MAHLEHGSIMVTGPGGYGYGAISHPVAAEDPSVEQQHADIVAQHAQLHYAGHVGVEVVDIKARVRQASIIAAVVLILGFSIGILLIYLFAFFHVSQIIWFTVMIPYAIAYTAAALFVTIRAFRIKKATYGYFS